MQLFAKLALVASTTRKIWALAAPYFRARRGHPVGISAKFRSELEALRGDEGAKKIIAANEAGLVKIPVGDPGVLRDIDTPQDLVARVIV